MNKAIELKNALIGLFRSGADAEHDESEMVELLDGIDFRVLLQSLCNDAITVYGYETYSASEKDFRYFGPTLLPDKAVMLCEDVTDCTIESALCYRSLELWLLPDMTFAVLSCFTVGVGFDRYITEYRTYKAGDWRETEMEIDFLALADELDERCEKVYKDEPPMFEV